MNMEPKEKNKPKLINSPNMGICRIPVVNGIVTMPMMNQQNPVMKKRRSFFSSKAKTVKIIVTAKSTM
jgi:hypothetical protein